VNDEQVWLLVAAGGAAALVLLVVCALLWRTTRRLADRIDELEAQRRTPQAAAAPVPTEPAAYVITGLTEDERVSDAEPVLAERIDGALFADIAARETVIKAAGLAHGLRRGLSAQARNRIRFEMKREVKRSRKQRRADLKAALRDLQERDRAGRAGEDAA
jgi:hypothetical protein